MNAVTKVAVAAAATGGMGALGWKVGTGKDPGPVDDGITKRELGPALGGAAFVAAFGTLAGTGVWLLGNSVANTRSPKMAGAVAVSAAVSLAFGTGWSFGLKSVESYDNPRRPPIYGGGGVLTR